SRALLNVVSIWRIRSGAAWVSRSARHAWGSISWGAVIARVPFEWDVGVSSKASRGDRFYFAVDTPTGVNVLRDSYTTLPDATVACYQCHDPQQLAETIHTWWPQIETFIETRVTNAKTEAANTTIKQIKRTGRG